MKKGLSHSDRIFFGLDKPDTLNGRWKKPKPAESYTQKLTRQRKELLAKGINPGSGGEFADNGETCGSCQFLVRTNPGNSSFFKCGKFWNGKGSETSDIRKKWPACKSWEPKE